MTNSRLFWLRSDGSIEEIHEKPWDLPKGFWDEHHLVQIHPNGEFYTNHNSIIAKHMKQLLPILNACSSIRKCKGATNP